MSFDSIVPHQLMESCACKGYGKHANSIFTVSTWANSPRHQHVSSWIMQSQTLSLLLSLVGAPVLHATIISSQSETSRRNKGGVLLSSLR
jgi:hypothetical protein